MLQNLLIVPFYSLITLKIIPEVAYYAQYNRQHYSLKLFQITLIV